MKIKILNSFSNFINNSQVCNYQLNTLINHEHKLIIYTNPKCASGTIKIWLLQLSGVLPTYISKDFDVDGFLGKSIHQYIKDNYEVYCSPKNLKRFNHYKKAIVVRNPWRRIVSFYCDKIIKKQYLESINIYTHESYDKQMSFLDFVDYIKNIDHSKLEHHLRSQVFDREQIQFDFFLKMETLDSNILEMSRNIGIQGPLELVQRNSTIYQNYTEELAYDKKPNEFEYIPNYTSFYNDQLIKIIEQKYAADIKILNYKFHD